jgi:DMSO reductase family type II enzyme chaperone
MVLDLVRTDEAGAMMNTELPAGSRELADARQSVYRFLALALESPSLPQFAWLTSPEFRPALAALAIEFDVAVPGGELFPEEYSDFESRYLACFEVGMPQAPVPLCASHYNKRAPVPATIHEHVLFYRLFGAAIAEGDPSSADHLRHELAFLFHLDELLIEEVASAESLLRARCDFLKRQVNRWVGRAAAAAHENGLPPVYQCLLELLAAAVSQDLELLKETKTPAEVSA